MSREMKQLSLWIDEELEKCNNQWIKMIKDCDPDDLAHKIAHTIKNQIDDPLMQIFGNLGILALDDYNSNNSPDKIYRNAKIGSELIRILYKHDKVSYDVDKEYQHISSFDKEKWRVSENKNGILSIKKNSGFQESQKFLHFIDKKWMESLLSGVLEESKEKPLYNDPQITTITPFDGFYHKEGFELVRRCNRNIKRKILHNPKKYKKFIDILNSRMEIGYTVDQEVLEVIRACNNDPIMTLSGKKMTKTQKSSIYRERKATLDQASTLLDETFYYYHFYDNRMGRIYCSATALKPDGSKLSKSLLKIADKQPIGQKGWDWLLVHAANTFGEDKLTLDERVDFANDHLDEWLVWASDPVKHKDWQNVDDPFNFLAAIIEIRRAVDSGDEYNYESGLIVAFDASCSGLQILSALVSCEVSGEMCNIFGNSLGDFYKTISNYVRDKYKVSPGDEEVYDKVIASIKDVKSIWDMNLIIQENSEDFKIANRVFWSRFSEKEMRTISKRPCMTYFYSCSKETMAVALWKDWRTEPGFQDLNPAFCFLLAKDLFYACKTIMKKPTKVMDLIIKMGQKAAEDNKQLQVITPFTNVEFRQRYYAPNPTKRMKINLKGKDFMQMRVFQGYKDKVNKNKVKSASAPNVVHMLDSQLVAAIIYNTDYVVSCIHDSFGTIPAMADKLFRDIREIFIDLFDKTYLLEGMLIQAGCEELIDEIEYGTGNIEDVRTNQYCFS